MVSTATIREKMELYVQLVNQRDIDAILELYAENATVEDPVGVEPLQGIDAIFRFYREGLGQSEASAEQTGDVRTTISGEGAIPFQVKVTFKGSPCIIREVTADGWLSLPDGLCTVHVHNDSDTPHPLSSCTGIV